ncbi:hypothetical protein E4U55_004711 [Claviceps digitariae]|nr:hypothetical protein E4U55_004711 [Claviceps digitariae]
MDEATGAKKKRWGVGQSQQPQRSRQTLDTRHWIRPGDQGRPAPDDDGLRGPPINGSCPLFRATPKLRERLVGPVGPVSPQSLLCYNTTAASQTQTPNSLS